MFTSGPLLYSQYFIFEVTEPQIIQHCFESCIYLFLPNYLLISPYKVIIRAIVASSDNVFYIRGQFFLLILLQNNLIYFSPHQSAVHILSITLYGPTLSVYTLAGEQAISTLKVGFPISFFIHSIGPQLHSSTSSCNNSLSLSS